jgi:hypothetical protein
LLLEGLEGEERELTRQNFDDIRKEASAISPGIPNGSPAIHAHAAVS